jgi:hypothetical protein
VSILLLDASTPPPSNYAGRGRARGGGGGARGALFPGRGNMLGDSPRGSPRGYYTPRGGGGGRGRGRGRGLNADDLDGRAHEVAYVRRLGAKLGAGAPLSRMLYEDRPLLRPVLFVRGVEQPTLFEEEEELLKPVVEDVGK